MNTLEKLKFTKNERVLVSNNGIHWGIATYIKFHKGKLDDEEPRPYFCVAEFISYKPKMNFQYCKKI